MDLLTQPTSVSEKAQSLLSLSFKLCLAGIDQLEECNIQMFAVRLLEKSCW